MDTLPLGGQAINGKRSTNHLITGSQTKLDIKMTRKNLKERRESIPANFAKNASPEKKPLKVPTETFYSSANRRYLEKIVTDIKEGKARFQEHNLIEVA
jgi:hypothetical protein